MKNRKKSQKFIGYFTFTLGFQLSNTITCIRTFLPYQLALEWVQFSLAWRCSNRPGILMRGHLAGKKLPPQPDVFPSVFLHSFYLRQQMPVLVISINFNSNLDWLSAGGESITCCSFERVKLWRFGTKRNHDSGSDKATAKSVSLQRVQMAKSFRFHSKNYAWWAIAANLIVALKSHFILGTKLIALTLPWASSEIRVSSVQKHRHLSFLHYTLVSLSFPLFWKHFPSSKEISISTV